MVFASESRRCQTDQNQCHVGQQPLSCGVAVEDVSLRPELVSQATVPKSALDETKSDGRLM
jgi:hypothetical protein